MINKLKTLVKNKNNIFLFSNMVFSGSTYLVMLYIPFLLNVEKMAQLSIIYNAMLTLVFIFELGISVAFLRFYQIKKNVLIISSVIQLLLVLILITLGNTYLGGGLFSLLNFGDSGPSKEIFFFAVICQLSWIFAKNILLSLKYYEYILILSVSVFMMRICSLYLLDTGNIDIDIENILIASFIVPFIPVAMVTIISNIKNIITIRIEYLSIRSIKIFSQQTIRFLKFSLFTYTIGLLYVLTSRYLMLYLSENGNDAIIADLGYAMTFLGVITIFSVSFRTYYISIFKRNDKNSIHIYLDNYLKKIKILATFGVFISVAISIVFLLVKPEYLSINSAIFLLINLISSSLVLLFSLITFLARTMNYNSLELKINIVRLLLVCITCHSIIPIYPVFGFLIINLIIVLAEIYFSKIVLKNLKYAC